MVIIIYMCTWDFLLRRNPCASSLAAALKAICGFRTHEHLRNFKLVRASVDSNTRAVDSSGYKPDPGYLSNSWSAESEGGSAIEA